MRTSLLVGIVLAASTTPLKSSGPSRMPSGFSGSSTRQAPSGYERIGEHKSGPCDVDKGPKKCVGMLPVDLEESLKLEGPLAETINSLTVVSPGFTTDRLLTDRTFRRMSVQAVGVPTRVRLRSLRGRPQNGIILAVITTDASGAPDMRYGLGNLAGFEKRFFLIAHGYDERIDAKDGESRRLAQWSVYGIKGTRLMRVGKQGLLRYCKHSHTGDERLNGAEFISCPLAKSVAAIESKLGGAALLKTSGSLRAALLESSERTSVLETILRASPKGLRAQARTAWLTAGLSQALTTAEIATLAKALEDVSIAPAWFTCGSGCCSAEDF